MDLLYLVRWLLILHRQNWIKAETEDLAAAIRADDRIPSQVRIGGEFAITVEHLPIFAEWRRRIDRYFETGELVAVQ